MRHEFQRSVVLLVVVALTAGCAAGSGRSSATPTDPGRSPLTPGSSPEAVMSELVMSSVARETVDPADAARAAAAINDVGLELLRRGTPGGENAVVSPASIVLALAMARAGAGGETAAEMDRVLRDVASDTNASWLNALDAALAMRSGTFKDGMNEDAEVLLRIANQSFAHRDFPLEAGYLDALASRFGSGVRLVDFIRNAEGARLDINGWVAEHTEGRIPELLGQGTVGELTRLVLVNAIYLKAAWLSPFDPKATSPGAFRRLDGSSIDVPMMRDTLGARYAEGDGWRAVELPYVGRQLAMLIVVPDDLVAFEAALDGAELDRIAAALDVERVVLSMPRFGIESKLSLREVLMAMGMPLAFTAGADFSGITPVDDLFISDVIHQANIDVDEEGTEAAAATAITFEVTSAPLQQFQLAIDRPFVFALRDVETGAILFLGRVVEPIERG